MKIGQIMLGLLIGLLIGALAGCFLAKKQVQIEVLSGPYSDNYGPAFAAIGEAKAKLRSGDTNVLELLNTAQSQIEQARQWTRRFLGHNVGNTNGR